MLHPQIQLISSHILFMPPMH